VTECPELAHKVVGAAADFHADQACEQRKMLGRISAGLPVASIHTMNSKYVLGEIDSDDDNRSPGLRLASHDRLPMH
jgi:hypothetical protein